MNNNCPLGAVEIAVSHDKLDNEIKCVLLNDLCRPLSLSPTFVT